MTKKMNFVNFFKLKFLTLVVSLLVFTACDNNDDDQPSAITVTTPEPTVIENEGSFNEVGSVIIGGGMEGAAEISAYDAVNKRLFVVNNAGVSIVDVIDFSDPTNMSVTSSITIASGAVNSVATSDTYLAIAIEDADKQANGRIEVYKLSDLTMASSVTVGALPDMVTFSPDGSLIICANEGEPDNYNIGNNDPDGSVSIIDINNSFTATTVSFAPFASQQSILESNGLRIFGTNASFTQDLEPEYVTISSDSQIAWVTLQENNGVARIDLTTKSVTDIFPLGFKDYGVSANAMDVSDDDGTVQFNTWANVYGMYQPDALEYFEVNGTQYIITANEGDARDYSGFSEEERVKDLTLDGSIFTASNIQDDDQLGRLEITTTLGNTGAGGAYQKLYSYGARSFSIWNATTGTLVYDSGNDIDVRANTAGVYPDGRSDAKGCEPEGVAVGTVNGKTIAFIGLERADAVMTYDISIPTNPQFLQIWQVGDAPEGILFIPASDSPNGRSLLVVSSEDDGTVKVYQPDAL